MEVNKDEAERCIEVAEKFVLEGQFEKAEKFLVKADRLYPTQKAKGRTKCRLGSFYKVFVCVWLD